MNSSNGGSQQNNERIGAAWELREVQWKLIDHWVLIVQISEFQGAAAVYSGSIGMQTCAYDNKVIEIKLSCTLSCIIHIY